MGGSVGSGGILTLDMSPPPPTCEDPEEEGVGVVSMVRAESDAMGGRSRSSEEEPYAYALSGGVGGGTCRGARGAEAGEEEPTSSSSSSSSSDYTGHRNNYDDSDWVREAGKGHEGIDGVDNEGIDGVEHLMAGSNDSSSWTNNGSSNNNNNNNNGRSSPASNRSSISTTTT